ncbi:unnamed protein product [Onchocerca flexuosa]|uniref:Bacteriophage protein n=1 Tax=Onchocerca flexuosa TaxID=387005 RepID=A0A183HAW5_9BILA|nr:unnamed protein product [Onchocerca flexuosa]
MVVEGWLGIRAVRWRLLESGATGEVRHYTNGTQKPGLVARLPRIFVEQQPTAVSRPFFLSFVFQGPQWAVGRLTDWMQEYRRTDTNTAMMVGWIVVRTISDSPTPTNDGRLTGVFGTQYDNGNARSNQPTNQSSKQPKRTDCCVPPPLSSFFVLRQPTSSRTSCW